MEINSQSYWEDRFKSGSWAEFDGGNQTLGFAKMLIENLPSWLKSELEQGGLNLLDAGCAEGGLVYELKKSFSSCNCTGMDFSESATKTAQELYKNCSFVCGDITTLEENYDIIFSSNTLEHFTNPTEVLKGFFKHAKKHVVLMLPFEEYELSKEHFSFFDFKSIPLISDEYILTYYQVLPPTPVWLDKQILLVFTQNEIAKTFSLNNAYNGYLKEIETLKNKLTEVQNHHKIKEQEAKEICESLHAHIQNKENEALELNEKISCQEAENLALKQQVEELLKEKATLERKEQYMDYQLKILAREKEACQADVASLNQELASTLSYIHSAINEATGLARTKTFKLAHLYNRLKLQYLKGSSSEKKEFLKWLKNHSKTTDVHHTYNQMFNVIHILEAAEISVQNNKAFSKPYLFRTAYDQLKKDYFDAINTPLTESAEKMRKILEKRECKGIIVYPHIIHWENMQTPQHLLRGFAKQGYICLFAEHNFTETKLREVEDNLFVLCEKDMIQSIYDKSVIVFCTWMCSMGWIEEIKNKVLWYHILDKIDIFANYDDEYVQKHDEVIKNADIVTYVAHELKRYLPENVTGYYLPNGTNVSDFMNIHQGFVPDDMKELVNSGKKIVGYYGLISYWFDMNMMTELADRNPDINFVFIGDYVEPEPLPERNNMFFFGKKPYNGLSDYAKFFDCAIIPFEISDMMDCVSPIKFFEYRALGLPVVSSYMKEMEQYKSDDVLIAHDTDSFEKAIFKTFEPEIKALAQKTGMNFAIKQQWDLRAQDVENYLNNTTKQS